MPQAGVVHDALLPDPLLTPFVHSYWQLRTIAPLAVPYVHTAVADGCIDLILTANATNAPVIVGFTPRFTTFELGTSFHYIGVRFLPVAFPLLFRVDASEIAHRVTPLSDFLPAWAGMPVASHFTGLADAKRFFDAELLRLVTRRDLRVDRRFLAAVTTILRTAGQLHTQRDLDTGVSPRQLRRLFELHIGDSPKQFSNVVRFQRMLHLRTVKAKDISAMEDAGYYDDAHMIRAFKAMFGRTPGQAFAR